MTEPVNAVPTEATDGNDWIEKLPKAWRVLRQWGSQGWELGDIPRVVIAVYINTKTDNYSLATYIEGDISAMGFASEKLLVSIINRMAELYWRNGRARGPDDLPKIGLLPYHKGFYVQ